MDIDTVDFLQGGVYYISKEEYIRTMKSLRKEWKKAYGTIANEIRALKLGEKTIGYTEIGPRDSWIYWEEQKPEDDTSDELETAKEEVRFYANAAGRLQSIRSRASKEATQMLADYMEDRIHLKRCAHYSFILNKMMQETNRRFC